jgi:hypothetical protein
LARLFIILIACLQVVQGLEAREHKRDDELGIIEARVDSKFNLKAYSPLPPLPRVDNGEASAPLPLLSSVDNGGSLIEEFLLEKGGEGRVRRAEEVTVDDMDGLFNTVSNREGSSYTTGDSLMANGDTVVLAVGSYKCSDGTCAKSSTMLGTKDLSGDVKCIEDDASCFLNGEQTRRGMWVKGTGAETLLLRAISFQDGEGNVGGGIGISSGAIVTIELCFFSNCISSDSSDRGGGAIIVEGSATIFNAYGTTFNGNTAASGDGNDIYWEDGTITIHNTCPSPYSSNTPNQGKTRIMRIV